MQLITGEELKMTVENASLISFRIKVKNEYVEFVEDALRSLLLLGNLKRNIDTRYCNPKCSREGAKKGNLGILRNQPTHPQKEMGVCRPSSVGRVGRVWCTAKGNREIGIGLECMRCLEEIFLDLGF